MIIKYIATVGTYPRPNRMPRQDPSLAPSPLVCSVEARTSGHEGPKLEIWVIDVVIVLAFLKLLSPPGCVAARRV